MKTTQQASRGGLLRKLRAQFLTGVILVVPLGATILILLWIFATIDNILQPVVRTVWSKTIPGIGFAVTILLIYIIGAIASNVVGKTLIRWGESLLARVPVVRQLYAGIRDILVSFSTSGKTGFMQVVLVEFPRKGMRAIGFVTNEFTDAAGEKLLSIFIPTAPNPTTGFLEIMRETEIVRTRIPVDVAIKMVVSAGRIMPKDMDDKLRRNNSDSDSGV